MIPSQAAAARAACGAADARRTLLVIAKQPLRRQRLR
jgi:hypothetical protein